LVLLTSFDMEWVAALEEEQAADEFVKMGTSR
jgi:hypothetical protein